MTHGKCLLSTREAPLSQGAQGFSWGSVTEAPDARREDRCLPAPNSVGTFQANGYNALKALGRNTLISQNIPEAVNHPAGPLPGNVQALSNPAC